MKRDPIQALLPPELIGLARFCRAALVLLNARLLSLLGVLLSAAAFAWVMAEPSTIRLAGACAFTLLTVWPLYRLESTRREQQPETPE